MTRLEVEKAIFEKNNELKELISIRQEMVNDEILERYKDKIIVNFEEDGKMIEVPGTNYTCDSESLLRTMDNVQKILNRRHSDIELKIAKNKYVQMYCGGGDDHTKWMYRLVADKSIENIVDYDDLNVRVSGQYY